MATTEMPAHEAADEQPRRPQWDDIDVPQLWMAEADESTQWRWRALVTTSIILHILLILTCPWWLRLVPKLSPVQVVVQQMQDQALTYLDMPNDHSAIPKKTPDTKIASDRDRIAQSKAPRLNREELNKILQAARPGPPGAPTPKGAAAAPPSPPVTAAQRQQTAGAVSAPPPAKQTQQTVAKLENLPPPERAQRNPIFNTAPAGSAVEQAARAAAAARAGGPSVGGAGGDYGFGNAPQRGVRSNVDVLSDTMGVDFGPYLARVLHDVREHWYDIIPEVARPPIMKKGNVSIQFAITKEGQVAGLRLVGSSGDVALDRAAWGGITGSNPFPPLPPEFRGQYLALRFRFLYNPDKSELQ